MFILKLSYSKPFHNTLNYASIANIEEVMKFYNSGDKTFETDFNLMFSSFKNLDRLPVHDEVVTKRESPRSNAVKAE